MRYILIVVLFLLYSGAASAQAPEQRLTLDQARQIALANHPEIKAAGFEEKSSEEDELAAQSAFYPQVSGDAVRAFAGTDTRIAATSGLNDPTVLDRGSAGVGVSQLITDFGRTSALVAASRAAVEAQQQRAVLSRDTVLLNVARAYYDVLRTQDQLEVAQNTLATRQKLEDQVRSLRDVKMRSDLDLSIAQQGVSDAKMLLAAAENNQSDAMATLSEALGYGETRSFYLVQGEAIQPPAKTLDASLNMALSKNPELAALKSDYDAAKKAADAARREQYPTISASGFVGATPLREDDQHIDPTYATGGINLTVPFYTGGKLTSDADKALYQEKAAQMRIDIKRNQLARDIHMAFDNVQTAYTNIGLTKQMHQNTRKSLELTQARYDIGKSSIVDLSQAQLAETQAAVAETDAIYDYLIKQAVLDYEAGGIF